MHSSTDDTINHSSLIARNELVKKGPYGSGSQLSFSPSGTYSKKNPTKKQQQKTTVAVFPLNNYDMTLKNPPKKPNCFKFINRFLSLILVRCHAIVPTPHFSKTPIVQQMSRWTETLFVQQPFVPKAHCSEYTNSLRLLVQRLSALSMSCSRRGGSFALNRLFF